MKNVRGGPFDVRGGLVILKKYPSSILTSKTFVYVYTAAKIMPVQRDGNSI